MTSRARCAVPFCRRTASTDEGFRDGEFLCGPHWRLRSPALRKAWLKNERLYRRNPGHETEHPAGSAARLVRLAIQHEHDELWERTKAEVIEAAAGL